MLSNEIGFRVVDDSVARQATLTCETPKSCGGLEASGQSLTTTYETDGELRLETGATVPEGESVFGTGSSA